MTDLGRSAADWLADVRELEARGALILAYDMAIKALDEYPDDIWLQYRAVLVMAKSGATQRAASEFQRLGLGVRAETDIAALEARIAKDEALAAPDEVRHAAFSRAAALYERVYQSGGGYYPAINVATLRRLAGDDAAAARTAEDVLVLCAAAEKNPGEHPYYVSATRAEALLVLGRIDEAGEAVADAAMLSDDLAARATTRRQLRLLCQEQDIDDGLLAPLAPPVSIHYVGHRMAGPGENGPLTPADEGRVAAEIAACLDRQRVGFGYGALASGADILFAEALLARGAELHIVLPFDAEEFVRASVVSSGDGWAGRFEACRANAKSVTVATEEHYLGHDQLFNYGSQLAMGLAVLRSRFIDGEARQMAVWDGQPPRGTAGTSVDVALWRSLGRNSDVIACGGDGADASGAPMKSAPEVDDGRILKAMLFGDVKGFSSLRDEQIPVFVTHVLGAWAEVLERYGTAVQTANTWGDAIYAVFADPVAAARCALDLQAAVAQLDLDALGLPDTLAVRLGGHFGPVYAIFDPVQKRSSFGGAHVSRTARIEPVTPPGEVYVTEALAARLALAPEHFECDYVGVVPAAKGYGTLRMYHLHAAMSDKYR